MRQKNYGGAQEESLQGIQQLLTTEQGKSLDQGQINSGFELAELFIKAIRDNPSQIPDSLFLDRTTTIFHLFPPGDPSKNSFMNSAIKYTIEKKDKVAEERLRSTAAISFWKLQHEFFRAQEHFLHCSVSQIDSFVQMLAEWAQELTPSERDLLIVRAVLSYLSHGKSEEGDKLFHSFMGAISQDSDYVLHSPLMNFTRLLLLTLNQHNQRYHQQQASSSSNPNQPSNTNAQNPFASQFVLLRDSYKTSLSRDPAFLSHVDRIGEGYFGIKTENRQGSEGLLGGLVQNLMREMLSGNSTSPN